MSNSKHTVAIIGGGTAGITVASRLLKANPNLDIAVIEPSEKHVYQPAWTLVGAGSYSLDDTVRSEASVMPEKVKWIKDYAEKIDPDTNSISTRKGDVITYDYLVVAPGIQYDLDAIEGLREGLDAGTVVSTYLDPEKVWEKLQNFEGGNALFTQPATPIKCGGAPQKIMYLADDHFQKRGIKDKTNVIFATPGSVIFGVKEFADTLMSVINRKHIVVKFFHKLTRIDNEKKRAYYTLTATDESQCTVINDDSNRIHEEIVGEATIAIPFNFMHTAPPQSAPDFIKASKLSYQDGPSKGWLNVDHNSLQHNVYPNVFGLGDAAALPTAKTGAAIRKQAPVVAENLLSLIQSGKVENFEYKGYSSCPLVTGYGKMVLAEFGYGNERQPDKLISTFVDTTKEQYSMWLLKKYGLPYMYWNLMLKGKA